MSHKVEFYLFILLAGIFGAAVIFTFVFFVFPRQNKTLPKSEITIGGKTLSVEVARSSLERMHGLSGRDALGSDGMLFIFDKESRYGFWMKDMKFAIDMIWIDKGKVTGFSENAVPEPDKQIWNLKVYYPPDVADSVLEVSAGFVSQNNIKAGDEVVLK